MVAKLELDERAERVAKTASELLATSFQIDDWLHAHELYEQMPPELQRRYTAALKDAARAYGQMKAAQYR